MNIVYLFTIIFLVLSSCSLSMDVDPDEDPPQQEKDEYVLVWADEFDIDGVPNPDNWSFEEGFVRNREWQWYQEQNAFVEDGLLVIEARRDFFLSPAYDAAKNDWRSTRKFVYYTSSSVSTKDKHAWTYGMFEIRARIKTEKGLWPAIWTVGQGHEWPQGGEIDIMEYYNGQILANAAWAGRQRWQPIWDSYKLPVSELAADWDNDFHVWRMEWTREFIKIYLDDRLLNTIALGRTFNKRGTISNPFRETQQFIILNLAIGSNGGNPENTEFPSKYEIDYVRVYQKK